MGSLLPRPTAGVTGTVTERENHYNCLQGALAAHAVTVRPRGVQWR